MTDMFPVLRVLGMLIMLFALAMGVQPRATGLGRYWRLRISASNGSP